MLFSENKQRFHSFIHSFIHKVLEKRPVDILKTYRKDVLRVTSLGRLRDVNFKPFIQMHFKCIIFNIISPNVCLKH